MLVDGKRVPGGIFDFGLYFFHNARRLLDNGSGPYFYLPKMESHLEARLWNDIFNRAQDELGIPRGTIKDRKSTRLNSSHANISYAVFCLKKKKKKKELCSQENNR